jgi:hypothetical protein
MGTNEGQQTAAGLIYKAPSKKVYSNKTLFFPRNPFSPSVTREKMILNGRKSWKWHWEGMNGN